MKVSVGKDDVERLCGSDTVTDDEVFKTGVSDVDRRDLISPLSKEQFNKLYDEAALESMSSDGALSNIAIRERKRIKKKPVAAAKDILKVATSEIISNEPSPILVKSEDEMEVPSPIPGPLGLTDWPGSLHFTLVIPQDVKPRNPQYSSKLHKLYIAQNKSVTLMLSMSFDPMPSTLSLRAHMVFTSPDHSQEVVKVCYQHSHNGSGQLRDPLAPHILRLTAGEPSVDVKYLSYTDTGKHAVLVSPLPRPAPGSQDIPITIRFTDLGSCPGGINRRETAVVFQLEMEGQGVIGRRVLPVRVCTCPKRDREHDEKERLGLGVRQGGGLHKVASPNPRPDVSMSGNEDQEELWVMARGRKNYEALLQVGAVLEEARGGDLHVWRRSHEIVNRKRK